MAAANMTPHTELRSAYDVIVIGGGVNGLSLAINLASSGMQTLIVEKHAGTGGQATTELPLLPGFAVHPHANYLSFHDLIVRQAYPSCRAIEVPTMTPIAQHGLTFRDGRAPVILYRRDCAQKTQLSLAHYSRRDARTYARCKEIADGLTPALAKLYFTVPESVSFRAYLETIKTSFSKVLSAQSLGQGSAKSLIDSLFEAEEVRTLFYLLSAEFLGDLDVPGGDVGLLGYVFWLLGRRSLPRTGMQAVPRALTHAALKSGVHLLTETTVERVLFEGGQTRGVQLHDGAVIDAGRVASSLGYAVSLTRLISPQALDHQEKTLLAQFQETDGGAIGSYAACLKSSPVYKSASHNPDINLCAQTFVGLDSTAEVLAHQTDLRMGLLPAPTGSIRVNSLWDPSQAPPGQHAAGADCAFPSQMQDGDTASIEHSFPAAFASMWESYAPGVAESILAHRITLSSSMDRKMMLRLGEAQYRGPANGLYFCGATTHPGGGVHGACGVNAFQVMLADRHAQLKGRRQ